ncbi:hypothetical protein PKF022_05880 [Polynucleobacter sp. KF022]|nr:hypothetical protein PKF022_05880 [Polynucleobacter sp. KF022]
MLEGWEVKAIRAGRVHIKEAYVVIRKAELFLIGCHITPSPFSLYPYRSGQYPH